MTCRQRFAVPKTPRVTARSWSTPTLDAASPAWGSDDAQKRSQDAAAEDRNLDGESQVAKRAAAVDI